MYFGVTKRSQLHTTEPPPRRTGNPWRLLELLERETMLRPAEVAVVVDGIDGDRGGNDPPLFGASLP